MSAVQGARRQPVAGCLPILLQMPVYIALYRMLANAGELYLQPFIPGWINDLTNVDPYCSRCSRSARTRTRIRTRS